MTTRMANSWRYSGERNIMKMFSGRQRNPSMGTFLGSDNPFDETAAVNDSSSSHHMDMNAPKLGLKDSRKSEVEEALASLQAELQHKLTRSYQATDSVPVHRTPKIRHMPAPLTAAALAWKRFNKRLDNLLTSTYLGILFDLTDVVMFFFDIYTDIQVLKVMHEQGRMHYFALILALVLGHYVLMAALVSMWVQRQTSRNEWWAERMHELRAPQCMWWPLTTLPMVLAIPILDFCMLGTSLFPLVFPDAHIVGSFLANYSFTRLFIEFTCEAFPQTLVQTYIYWQIRSDASRYQQFIVLLSIGASAFNVLKHSWKLWKASDSAGMPLREYFKYLLLLKGNYDVPSSAILAQHAEMCALSGDTLTMNGFTLHKNKSKLGPAQQAYILMAYLDWNEDSEDFKGVKRWVLSGCPLNAINRIVQKAMATLPSLEVIDMNECAFRGENFNAVTAAILRHPHVHTYKLVQSGVLRKYRNNKCEAICELFKPSLQLLHLSICVPWWDTECMERAAKNITANDCLETLSIEFPVNRGMDLDLEALQGVAPTSKLGVSYGAALSMAVRRCSALRDLTLAHHTMDDDAIGALLPALSSAPSLTALSLRGSYLGDKGTCVLARNLRGHPRMSSLVLRRCGVHNEGVVALAAALGDSPALRRLDLSHNRVLPDGLRALARAVKFSPGLEKLQLEGWREAFEEAGPTAALAIALASNRSLRSLSLAGSIIGNAGFTGLAQALAVNTTLASLDLSLGKKVAAEQDEGALTALVNAIPRHHTLTDLNLSGNRVGLRAAATLGVALAGLVSLDLTGCELRTDHVAALAPGLAATTSLVTLRLGEWVYSSMEPLAEALVHNHSLLTLDLSYSRCSGGDGAATEALQLLAQALKANSTLTSLSLAYVNKITDTGAAELSRALSSNRSLTTLDLSGCSSEMVARWFGESLAGNVTLRSLVTTDRQFAARDLLSSGGSGELIKRGRSGWMSRKTSLAPSGDSKLSLASTSTELVSRAGGVAITASGRTPHPASALHTQGSVDSTSLLRSSWAGSSTHAGSHLPHPGTPLHPQDSAESVSASLLRTSLPGSAHTSRQHSSTGDAVDLLGVGHGGTVAPAAGLQALSSSVSQPVLPEGARRVSSTDSGQVGVANSSPGRPPQHPRRDSAQSSSPSLAHPVPGPGSETANSRPSENLPNLARPRRAHGSRVNNIELDSITETVAATKPAEEFEIRRPQRAGRARGQEHVTKIDFQTPVTGDDFV